MQHLKATFSALKIGPKGGMRVPGKNSGQGIGNREHGNRPDNRLFKRLLHPLFQIAFIEPPPQESAGRRKFYHPAEEVILYPDKRKVITGRHQNHRENGSVKEEFGGLEQHIGWLVVGS